MGSLQESHEDRDVTGIGPEGLHDCRVSRMSRRGGPDTLIQAPALQQETLPAFEPHTDTSYQQRLLHSLIPQFSSSIKT